MIKFKRYKDELGEIIEVYNKSDRVGTIRNGLNLVGLWTFEPMSNDFIISGSNRVSCQRQVKQHYEKSMSGRI